MGNFKILFQDENVLAIDKPAGIVVDDIPRRVHRLDKDTSGVCLVAKNDQSLEFLQKQFQERKVKKKYLALVVGNLKEQEGTIETLLGRSPKDRKKQRAYLPLEPGSLKGGRRLAITRYRVLERYTDNKNYYTLVEVVPKTGRKHQIRAHLAYIGYPIAGDKMYGFKKQPCPGGLERQFLHAGYLKIRFPDGEERELKSNLPEDLKKVLANLKIYDHKN